MVQAGQQVGEYIIEAEIGGGGMAKVYRARHAVLDTVHALKVLDPKYRSNAEARKRFLDEAKIQAKHLNHSHIVKVTNIVATSDVAALVMDLVSGGNLEGYIESRRKPVDTEMFMHLVVPILEALGHAHEAGIVHRDIKPANVLLRERNGSLEPMLTDFGIAKVGDKLSSKKKSTHADARMGTLAYMSPEQIRQAKNVTARSDIFSLGAMFYELATGHVPFDGDSDFDIMQAIVQGSFEKPDLLAKSDLPAQILDAIRRAMEPDPDKRFASCDEFIAALGGKRSAVGAALGPRHRAKSAGGRRWGAFAVLALVVVGAGGAAVFFARGRDAKDYENIIATGSGVSDAGMERARVHAGTKAVNALPTDAAVPAAIADTADTVDTVDTVDTADAAPAAPPDARKQTRPVKPACIGRWHGNGRSVTIRRKSGACGQLTLKSGTMTCTGSLHSCSASGRSFGAGFRCRYDKINQSVSGRLSMTCRGRSASATMRAGGRSQYWSLKKR